MTDELGQNAVQNFHPLYDFNATISHLLGLDHERLIFERNGIQLRPTNVEDMSFAKSSLKNKRIGRLEFVVIHARPTMADAKPA
ncbi:DUF1501 domain-containing protein [Rubripirellula reticaptiva]|uniref:DUF1501 domain-containing protein n=1 Tax=Rubripirellula reticaptiva TaxID=2528013 RepID=UPI0036F1C096